MWSGNGKRITHDSKMLLLFLLLIVAVATMGVGGFQTRSQTIARPHDYYSSLSSRHVFAVVLDSANLTPADEAGFHMQSRDDEDDDDVFRVLGGNKADDLSIQNLNNDDGNEKPEYTVEATPESQALIAKITENYVFGKHVQTFTVDEILALIEKEFRVRNVPVHIGQTIFDADTTGVATDQSVTEILSFAAYHGLPKRLTAELLDDSLGDPFATAKKVFLKKGWKSVTFPKGLAIQPCRTSSSSASLRRRQRRRWKWWEKRQGRIQEAMRAVQAAAAARSPIRQLQVPKDFLTKLMTEEITKTDNNLASKKDLLFFPSNLPVPKVSWKRLQLSVEKASSTIKQKGKAGILAYALFNFCFYTVGMLWHWRGIASAHVTSSSSALTLTTRKFVRVFATVFIASNVLKIPKLLTIATLIPTTDRFLKATRSKSGWSEKKCLVLCMSALVSVWVLLLTLPVATEYLRLRRLVLLETAFDQYVVEPAMAQLTVA